MTKRKNSLTFELPVQTVSEANQREHWTKRHARKDRQQDIVATFAPQWLDDLPAKPWKITLTRLGPRYLDEDNNAGSFKHVQDQLARELGIDDGDREAARWWYVQRKRLKSEGGYGVEVTIETREPHSCA